MRERELLYFVFNSFVKSATEDELLLQMRTQPLLLIMNGNFQEGNEANMNN